MEQVVEEFEDIELDEDDSDGSDKSNTIDTSLDKLFNFDILFSVVPSITRIKPPNFDLLVYVPANPKTEPELVGKTYYYRNDAAKGLVLPHKWMYYYCGCTEYDIPKLGDDRIVNECTIDPIQSDTQVYTVTIFLNRRTGRTTSQRWKRSCWDKLRPVLEHSWLEYRYQRDQEEQQRYFDLHSVVNERGERVPEPAKRPGRPAAKETLALSSEDASKRIKLVQQRASYFNRYNRLRKEGKDVASVSKLLDNIYDQILDLGGVPNAWIRYGTDSTTESIITS